MSHDTDITDTMQLMNEQRNICTHQDELCENDMKSVWLWVVSVPEHILFVYHRNMNEREFWFDFWNLKFETFGQINLILSLRMLSKIKLLNLL